jgi:hypothetical protein
VYRHIKQFMSPEEVRDFNDLVQGKSVLFKENSGRGGLGPKWRVIDGEQIRSQMPEIETYGEQRVRPIAEQFAEHPLELIGVGKGAMRIQAYEKKNHGFRWHFDRQPYGALVTLKNTNRGQTHVVSRRLSQFLRVLFYPFFAVPQVFSIVPFEKITMEPGDLLIIRGSLALHRGVTLEEEGERVMMTYFFNEIGKKPFLDPIREKIARRLNF